MIAPKKSLGQHFLRDENIARKIVEHLHPENQDVLVEIGPGTGALTKHLVGRGKAFAAIEVDARALEVLRGRFADAEFVHSDVLGVRLDLLSKKYGDKLRIVGNIPYYIASEILFWLFDAREAVRDAILMMQLEVAQRLIAKPRTKEYGILSVFSQFYSSPELLFQVSKNSFFPKPNVDSAVVRLNMVDRLPAHAERLFRNVVRSTFGKRRKTLYNGLRYMGLDEKELAGVPFDLTRRPEELSVEEFFDLTRKLEPYEDGLSLKF